MKIGYNFILILIIVFGCSKNSSNDDSRQAIDSTMLNRTLGDEEQAMWDYFQSVERELEKDSKIQKEKIPHVIQTLIDNGDLQKPLIFLDGKNGTESNAVDYLTYKRFRKNNPIDKNRLYVISLRMTDNSVVDSIGEDSIRNVLLKQLSIDSIKK